MNISIPETVKLVDFDAVAINKLMTLITVNLSTALMFSYLSIWIDSKPIVWDFSWYVSDINLVLV